MHEPAFARCHSTGRGLMEACGLKASGKLRHGNVAYSSHGSGGGGGGVHRSGIERQTSLQMLLFLTGLVRVSELKGQLVTV